MGRKAHQKMAAAVARTVGTSRHQRRKEEAIEKAKNAKSIAEAARILRRIK